MLVAAAATVVILGLIAPYLFDRSGNGTILVQAESLEVANQLAEISATLTAGETQLRLLPGKINAPAGSYVVSGTEASGLSFSQSTIDVKPNQQVILLVSRSTPMEPPDPPEPPALQPIELIPLVDAQRDIRGDDWKIKDGTLVSNSNGPSMLQFPYRPPDEYRLELVATRIMTDDSLNLGLVAGDDPIVLSIDAFPGHGSRSGLSRLGGRSMFSRSTYARRGQLLPMGEPVPISATLHRFGDRVAIEMTVGGELVFSWRGAVSEVIATREFWNPELALHTPDAGVLSLVTWSSSIRVSDVRVIPLSEPGRILQFTDPASDQQRSAAELVIGKGGTVSIADELGLDPTPAVGGFELIRKFEGHTGSVKSVAFSPDGRFILTSGMSPQITPWNIASGGRLQTFSVGDVAKFEEASFTPDGTRIIATSGRQRIVFVWDRETGNVIHQLPQPQAAMSFAVTPDNRFLAIGLGNGTVTIVELETGDQVKQLAAPVSAGGSMILFVDISNDGSRIMAGSQETVCIWNLQSGQLIYDFRSPAYGKESVQFTPDGHGAVVSAPLGITSLVDFETRRVVGTTPRIDGDGWSAAVSTDGRNVLTCGGLKYIKGQGFMVTGDYALRLWKLGKAEVQLNDDSDAPLALVQLERLAEIPENPRIVSVDMQGSQWFRDEDAAFFADLSDQQSLDLTGTPITTASLENIDRLPSLTKISLAGTEVESLPTTLATQLPMLVELDLSGSAVSEISADALIAFESLASINLSASAISDETLATLPELRALQELDLSETAITSQGLEELISLASLRKLILSSTDVDSLSMFTSGKYPQLAIIDVRNAPISKEQITRLEMTRPEVNIVSGFDPIDVLSLIDTKRDAVDAGWLMENDQLRAQPGYRTNAAKDSGLELPISLPLEFELICTVTRTNGTHSPVFQLPLPDGTRVMVGFDHWPNEGGYTIIHGGYVKIILNNQSKDALKTVTPQDNLPKQRFSIAEILGLTDQDLPQNWLAKVGQLRSLERLTLSENRFNNADLAPLAQVKSLRYVHFYFSNLNDEGLSYLAQLPRLRDSSVRGTEVTPNGIAALSGNPTLAFFDIGESNYDETVCEVFATLPAMGRLRLIDAPVVGSDMQHLGKMLSLKHLTISDSSRLRDTDLRHLNSLRQLELLSLTHGSFTADAVDPIVRLPSLQIVDLRYNSLGDEGVERLSEINALSELLLDSNGISGVGVASLARCKDLRVLSLKDNSGITNESVSAISKLAGLRELHLTGTGITADAVERLRKRMPQTRIIFDASSSR